MRVCGSTVLSGAPDANTLRLCLPDKPRNSAPLTSDATHRSRRWLRWQAIWERAEREALVAVDLVQVIGSVSALQLLKCRRLADDTVSHRRCQAHSP